MKNALNLILVAIALSISNMVHASDDMQLRGKYAACQNNQKMSLWDLSSSSPLIRDDMLKSNYCWLTVDGIRIIVSEYLGKFARVTNQSGSMEYLVYRADIEKVPSQKVNPIKTSDRQIIKIQRASVSNTVKGEVYDIGGKPTVRINVKVDDKLSLDFSIVKSEIIKGFDVTIENQKNPKMQFGGVCNGMVLGIGKPDFYRVKITDIDQANKKAIFQISGELSMCSLDLRYGYRIKDAEFIISGKNFSELTRLHTKTELAKRFVPFKW